MALITNGHSEVTDGDEPTERRTATNQRISWMKADPSVTLE